MPITLPASFKAEIERPHGTNPLLWFWQVELARASEGFPQIIFRITNHYQSVAWPVGSPGSETWYPFPFTFTPIEQNQEGDLPQVDLSLDNSARLLMRYLHAGDALEGNKVVLYLVPANGLAIAYPNHEYQQHEFQIAGCSATEEAVTFRLERANFFNRSAPQDRYSAPRCRWEFGSLDGCGYIISAAAAFTSCPKTVDACTARGADELARGLPVLHPARFGGFPGIPRQRR